MPNRRRFLQAAAAVSAAPAVGGGAASARTPGLNIDRVIYDERYAPARAFGRQARILGAPVRRIAGDVTDLWTGELAARLREAAAPIAGLTGRDALFCLEQLGWDSGMRVIFQAEHREDETGRAEHRVVGGADEALARELDEAGSAWAQQAARLVLDWRGGAADPAAGLAPFLPGDRTLVSWIIAPANQAAARRV